MSEQDVLREFLLESNENLNRFDSEIIELEQRPGDKDLLASIFRTIHTIKGTCGFLGFSLLERIAHQAENLLSMLRSGEKRLSPRLITVILECVDAIRRILANLETTGKEGPDEYRALIERLAAAAADPGDDPEIALPPADTAPAETEKTSAVSESAIRVDVGLLDKLMNLVGELVLARNQVLQFTTQKEDAALNATAQRLNLITTELQENVMKTRMQPIGVVWNKLPRLVRDTAHACGRLVRLDLDGAGTELDKTIIEAIKDPLTHLVRNCCDHGIESPDNRTRAGKPPHGVITLKAYHEGGQVNIEVADDGAGVDVIRVKAKALEKGLLRPEQAERMSEHEAMHLLFLPGFSTAGAVTNVSGRGVGLDVVRCNIERIGGVVDISSTRDKGTLFRLKIPLTLAIIPGLVVVSGGERFLIPQASLLELIRIEGDSASKIERVHGTPVYRRRGHLLPLAFLNDVLGLPRTASDVVNIVVLQAEDRQFGLVVDGIKDTQEIVVKPLGKQLKGLTVYSGATIMGDGRVALILDVLGIGQRSGVLANHDKQSHTAAQAQAAAGSENQRMLLFRAGSFSRLAVPLSLVARLEEFPLAQVERAGGRHVVQYRGGILTLVSLASVLEPESTTDTAVTQDPIQAIVFSEGERSLGIMVDQILDIVDESVTIRQSTKRLGLLGSAVVGKEVTDFLDVRAVVQASAPEWLEGQASLRKSVVMLAEPSPFLRGLVRGELEMAGHRVVEAGNAEEALSRMEASGTRVVLAASNLPPEGWTGLQEAMRQQPNLADIAVLELTPSAHSRESMLASVAKLAEAVVGLNTPVPTSSLPTSSREDRA